MAGLNYYDICQLYTLEQIEEKITYYQEIIDGVAGNKMYRKDTSQGMQQVENQGIQDVIPLLQVYLRAKNCKLGNTGVNIVSANFGGNH